MTKIDLKPGEIYTDNDGLSFEVLLSPETTCNACKGCHFFLKAQKPNEAGLYLSECKASSLLLCSKPNRIFKQIIN
jgi:hypothetical protein